ncbi:hypothetical protein BC833DRAFT_578689 [Globomyces pollinis-pini]|nr:hypothetical protein BC833DRAFT_578689 [Globomyces pollinis-pini]
MKDILPYLKQTQYTVSPKPSSIIVIFSMLNYLERFSALFDRKYIEDTIFSPIESELVQLVCRIDLTLVKFPLGLLASHAMNIFTGSNESPRTLEESYLFLSQYFSIAVPIDHNVGESSLLIEAKDIQSWRDLLLTHDDISIHECGSIDLKHKGAKNSLYISESSFSRDVLFVDFTFTQHCNIFIGLEGSFLKCCACPEEHPKFNEKGSHLHYLSAIYKKLGHQSPNLLGTILTKCLIFHDVLLKLSKPLCLIENDPLGSLISLVKDHNCNIFEKNNGHNLILSAYLDLKDTLSTRPDRLEELFTCLNRYFTVSSKSQADKVSVLTSLSTDTINALVLDYQKDGQASTLMNLFHHFTNVEYESFDAKELETLGISWHCFLVSMHVPELIALAYVTLLDMNVDEIYTKRILERFEVGLLLEAEKNRYQTTFQQMLVLLNGNANSLLLSKFTRSDLCLGYFDILKTAEENKKDLFKVNIQLHYYQLYGESKTEDDMEVGDDGEEGECVEEGAIQECLSDIQAGKILFPIMDDDEIEQNATHVQKKVKTTNSTILMNALIGSELVETSASDSQLNLLQVKYLEKWNKLFMNMPSYVFQASLMELYKEYFPSDTSMLLGYVFVDFIMLHQWAFKFMEQNTVNSLFTTHSGNSSYNRRTSPYSAFIKYFKDLEPNAILSDKSSGVLFLQSLTKELALQISLLIVPKSTSLSGQTRLNSNNEIFDITKSASFPKHLIDFLYDCLKNMPTGLVKKYFTYLFTKADLNRALRTGMTDPFEVIFTCVLEKSMKSSKSNGLLNIGVKFLILNDTTKQHVKFFNLLSVSLGVLQTYFGDSSLMNPSKTELLEALLIQSTTEPVFQIIKERIFIPSIKIEKVFSQLWLPILIKLIDDKESQANSPLNNIGKRLLDSLQTDFHSVGLKSKLMIELIGIISNHPENPKLKQLFKSWEVALLNDSELNVEALKCYSTELHISVKPVLETHVWKRLKENPTITINTILNESLLTEKNGLMIVMLMILDNQNCGEQIIESITKSLIDSLFSIFSVFSHRFNPEGEREKWDLFLHHLLIQIISWLDKDGHIMVMLSNPDLHMLLRDLIILTDAKATGLILSILEKYHFRLTNTESLNDSSKMALREIGCVWSVYLRSVHAVALKHQLVPAFAKTMTVMMEVYYVHSMAFVNSVSNLAVSLLNSIHAELMFEILTKALIGKDIAKQLHMCIWQWLHTQPLSKSFLKLYSEWFKITKNINSGDVLILEKSLQREDLMPDILDLLAIVPPTLIFHLIPIISNCLKNTKVYPKAMALLIQLRKEFKKNDKDRGVSWFDHCVADSLSDVSDGGVGFQAILKEALSEMKEA